MISQENKRALVYCLSLLPVSNHVGTHVSLVELHSLNYVQGCLDGLGFLDCDYSVSANCIYCLGDKRTDLLVVVRGDCCNLLDGLAGLDGHCPVLEGVDYCCYGLIESCLQLDWA